MLRAAGDRVAHRIDPTAEAHGGMGLKRVRRLLHRTIQLMGLVPHLRPTDPLLLVVDN